mmetsp:Transcript_6695/g.7679  ORF Transcript_6695/g.7679 Transcript_6695/m.7679 type:complete len:164 (-) Transcript_6695:1239-1730(-)
MGLKTDDDTVVILRKLGLFIPSFYALYYLVSVIYCAGFGLDWSLLGKFPFYIDDNEFKPILRGDGASDRELPLATWLSNITTFLLAPILIFFIVNNTRKSWDYAVTISFVHWLMCCIVMQGFPVNWIWWVTMVVMTFLLSSGGELSIYYLRDMREIELEDGAA